jgi:hypothetical protein
MKFCYVDESGTGDQPIAVMAGVVVDAWRMRPTKSEWSELLQQLAEIVGRDVKEFHTRDFYAGNGPWRELNGETRKAVIGSIFEWYAGRKHQIVYSVIDKHHWEDIGHEHPHRASIGSLWSTLGLHVALSLQKAYQRMKGNKGNTVLIFDNHEQDHKRLTELLLEPPEWTDTYYDRSPKNRRLDQIVDVPHFVDSTHVGLIQLADCVSYFLRRHLEIAEGLTDEAYPGEGEIVGSWAEAAFRQSIPVAAMYPSRGRCETAEFFHTLAPPSVRR